MSLYGAIAAAMLLVLGVFLFCVGMQRSTHEEAQKPAELRVPISQRMARFGSAIAPNRAWVVGALVVGVGAALFTGWLLWVILAPAVVVVGQLVLSDPPDAEVEWLGALDRWLRAIIASLATGKSINEALKNTVKQAPKPLDEPVGFLALRLRQRWSLDEALIAFTRDCAHAEVDAVAAALLVAGRRGGSGAGATLDALADSVQDRLMAARDTAAERAKPRIVVRQITAITLAVVGFAAFSNPGYFTPFNSPLGTLLLLVLIAFYLLALFRLRVMSSAPARTRVLAISQLHTTEHADQGAVQSGDRGAVR